jgi:GNAT superfamily N-acetyltransferase
VSELDDVLVGLRGRLADVPALALPEGFTVRDLDPADPADVAAWLGVVNAAFGRDWTVENHHLAMVVNPVLEVDRTFLAERDGVVVGTASVGRFRANPEVGIGHYLAVHPSAQGGGLATGLCSHRYRALAATGLEVAEAQTHLHRTGSLRAHFRCGFVPKVTVDPWNSLTPASGPLREEADRRVREAFAAWRAGR